MNEVLKTITDQYSCRGSKNQLVEQDKAEKIIKAGLQHHQFSMCNSGVFIT